jgi:hypothetical protein
VTLLDFAGALSFVTLMWACIAVPYKLSWLIVDFIFDEIDLYFDRRYPDAI